MSTDIMNRVEEIIPSLSAKQKIIAFTLLQDPLAVSFLSVKELSAKIDVSPATIVRFAKLVTNGGYPQMQAELHEHVQSVANPIKRMKLNIVVNSKDDEFLSKVYDTQISNLRKTFNQDMIRCVNGAYDLIMDARHIYTIGSRGSFCASYYLGQHLNRALGNVDIVEDDDKLADYMRRMTDRDLAIFVCAPRYSGRMYAMAQKLRAKDTKIVTINDAPASPFAPLSDISFFAPCTSNDFHNSAMSSMLIAEMLISLVITKNREDTLNSLSEYEQYFTSLNQFYSKDSCKI